MAKTVIACREGRSDHRLARWHVAIIAFCGVMAVPGAHAQFVSNASPAEITSAAVPPASTVRAPTRTAPRGAKWLGVPRMSGRLKARDLGLVINTADPYSVEVGKFYAAARRLGPGQVLRVELPLKPVLTPDEFKSLQARIEHHFGAATQALALAWTTPYAVNCNSITGALALGYDAGLCAQTCAPSKLSPYFNASSARPYADLKLRPSMLLAAKDPATAKRLIERGVKSDHSLALRGGPPVNAYFVITKDRARSVRAALFPPPGLVRGVGVRVRVESTQALDGADRVLLYETGLPQVDKLDTVNWVPGALADHLTSFGGRLNDKGGQMNVLEWISSGATASYGTVSEPCSHPQKFPHPQVLLLHYMQGSTAIEAYWKSVAWPQQGVFVGEPLAAPFARP